MRDLGGIPVSGGVVGQGRLYRSASLAKLDTADQAVFVELGIDTVYDLRTAAERNGALDQLPTGTRAVWLDVAADAPDNIAASIPQLMSNPASLEAALGGGKAESYLEDANRQFITMPSARAAYRDFYLDLIDDARVGAGLFHCTTGKDRTGWAAASFLLLLGASEDDMRADYLETNTDLAPALKPMLDALAAKGVNTEFLQPVLGVRESYIAAALDQMHTSYGTIEDYAHTALGLSDAQLATLRERFIDTSR